MTYAVKEIFYTLQGEGANAGRPAVFCRFAGCNLWTGREADRAAATCTFCDTDFVGTTGPGGGKFATADALARAVVAQWPESHEPSDARERWRDESRSRTRRGPLVVCTGGEPLLQLDRAAIDALHEHGCEIAVETNGTQPAPHGIDWLCVSPKSTAPLVLERGDELKLVYPQHDAPPDRFESLDFSHFFLQPMDGASSAENTAAAVRYCLTHPRWRLSLQTHKMLGIP